MSRVKNPVVSRSVDGGLSGELTVTVGTGNEDVPPAVFVESSLLELTLVLSFDEADDLAHAIGTVVSKACHELGLPDAVQRWQARQA